MIMDGPGAGISQETAKTNVLFLIFIILFLNGPGAGISEEAAKQNVLLLILCIFVSSSAT